MSYQPILTIPLPFVSLHSLLNCPPAISNIEYRISNIECKSSICKYSMYSMYTLPPTDTWPRYIKRGIFKCQSFPLPITLPTIGEFQPFFGTILVPKNSLILLFRRCPLKQLQRKNQKSHLKRDEQLLLVKCNRYGYAGPLETYTFQLFYFFSNMENSGSTKRDPPCQFFLITNIN